VHAGDMLIEPVVITDGTNVGGSASQDHLV
jgi:hypothetical protein